MTQNRDSDKTDRFQQNKESSKSRGPKTEVTSGKPELTKRSEPRQIDKSKKKFSKTSKSSKTPISRKQSLTCETRGPFYEIKQNGESQFWQKLKEQDEGCQGDKTRKQRGPAKTKR